MLKLGIDGLPQVHDWFSGLLTANQWVFAYIISVIVVSALAIWIYLKVDDFTAPVSAGLFTGAVIPLISWGVIWCLLNFISYMIYLLNT